MIEMVRENIGNDSNPEYSFQPRTISLHHSIFVSTKMCTVVFSLFSAKEFKRAHKPKTTPNIDAIVCHQVHATPPTYGQAGCDQTTSIICQQYQRHPSSANNTNDIHHPPTTPMTPNIHQMHACLPTYRILDGGAGGCAAWV